MAECGSMMALPFSTTWNNTLIMTLQWVKLLPFRILWCLTTNPLALLLSPCLVSVSLPTLFKVCSISLPYPNLDPPSMTVLFNATNKPPLHLSIAPLITLSSWWKQRSTSPCLVHPPLSITHPTITSMGGLMLLLPHQVLHLLFPLTHLLPLTTGQTSN